MKTYFASPERTSKEDLKKEMAFITDNPIMSGLLKIVSGLLAVLDENRQIIAANSQLLKILGIDDVENVLGLRPGEALQCLYSNNNCGGCGTSKYCSTCGAAIAIVMSQKSEKPIEKICSITSLTDETEKDIVFKVRAQKFVADDMKFTLLFLNDITDYYHKASLQHTFFHDINNMLCGVMGASQLLSYEIQNNNLVETIFNSSIRLKKEIEIQRMLLQENSNEYKPILSEVLLQDLFSELKEIYKHHKKAQNKKLTFEYEDGKKSIKIDVSLVMRVLGNMITNALEATEEGKEAKIKFETNGQNRFSVWNHQAISKDFQLRVFKRFNSTKSGIGRGLGTYSMKLLGEHILGGKVGFDSSQEKGTVFTFDLPKQK